MHEAEGRRAKAMPTRHVSNSATPGLLQGLLQGELIHLIIRARSENDRMAGLLRSSKADNKKLRDGLNEALIQLLT